MPRNALAAADVFEPDPNNPLTGNYTAADAPIGPGAALFGTALAPDPGWEYGSVLPMARNRETGQYAPAVPGLLRSFLRGAVDLGDGPSTGTMTPDATGTLGMLAGSNLMARPGGTLLAAVGPKGLGLDAEAMKVLRDMTPGFRAYHGSPHSFDKFSSGKIGTGEGAQAFGHGLYFADSEGVARSYRDALSDPQFDGGPYNPDNLAHRAAAYLDRANGDPKAATASLDFEHQQMQAKIDDLKRRFPMLSEDTILNGRGRIWADEQQRIAETRDMVNDPTAKLPVVSSKGHMYEVNVAADPAHFLDWDKPLSEQSPHVQQAIGSGDGIPGFHPGATGREIWQDTHGSIGRYDTSEGRSPAEEAARRLQAAGIPGIRYLDGSSRAGGEGTRNSVIFDPATIAILRKYGLAGLMAGSGAAASGQPQQ